MRRSIALLVLVIVASGCGLREPLQPAQGRALPIAPPQAARPLTPDELLSVSSEMRPLRVDEVLTRSQPRGQDPFDLPPATLGGEAPPETPSELEPRPAPNTGEPVLEPQ